MAIKRVALVGATGETGSSIIDGLLASNTFVSTTVLDSRNPFEQPN